MRNLLPKTFLLITLVGCFSFIFAQGHKTIQVTPDKGSSLQLLTRGYDHLILRNTLSAVNVNPVNTPAGVFNDLFCEGYTYNFSDFGRPHLPVRTEMIEIPLGATVQVNILSYQQTVISLNDQGVINKLTPAQQSVSKSDNNPPYYYDAAYYNEDNFNTSDMVTVNESGMMRGVRLGQVVISPFRYNPADNTLLIYYDIEFEIVFNNANIPLTISSKKEQYSPVFDGAFSKLINYENEGAKDAITVWPITYLIVAHRPLEATLQPFIQWKTKKGFKVVVEYTDVIGSTTTAIKTWIQNQYNTLSPKPTFVLLIGDIAQIPPYSGTTGTHPTDVYYCTFDGSSDYIPELYYGRISAETTTELNVVIGKTLMHEQYTWPNEAFLDRCVMIAGVDATYAASHGNGQIYYGIDNYFSLSNGYSNVYAYLYGTSSHPYQVMSSNSTGASADIRAKISAGVGFANYTAHCSEPGWADPSFTTTNIPALTNSGMYPLMIGNCCLSAKFNYTSGDCFAEQIVNVAEKGAVGYIGASNNSYWDEDFYWGVGLNSLAISSANSQNHTYANTGRGAYDGVWHTHGEPYAQWFVTAREMAHYGNLAVESSTSTRKKYYWEIYHSFGDPSLMAYLSIPTALTVSHGDIAVGATTLLVNTEQHAYVALSQNGVLLNAQYSGTNTSVTLTFPAFTAPGTADIVVTKQNRKPHIGTVNIVGTVMAPVADFSGTPTTVYTGNSVQFTDLSTNTPTSWAWTFTGGTPTSSTAQNPSIVYNTPGTYAVSLTATNSAGSDTETKNGYITVLANTNPPVADFSASATTVVVGSTVTFTDLSINSPTSWAWTFAGGTPGTATTQNPAVQYNTIGTYQVALTATNAYGSDTETKTAYITVTAPTYCDAGSSSAAYEYISNVTVSNINNTSAASTYTNYTTQTANMTIGDAYPFTVSIANGYATDQVLIWIDWNQDGDFADAGETMFTSAPGTGPFTGSITPPAGATTGTTRMRVRLHDTNTSYSPNATPCGNSGYGEVEDYSVNVLSNNAPPVAAFSANTTSSCDGIIDFTDLSSGSPTSWAWDFGDGQTATTQNPSHTYTTSGTYTIVLTATNGFGSDTETITDMITISLPAAPATTDASRCGTGSVTLEAAGTGTLNWYDAATAGSLVNTGTTFTTPSLTATTTYYVESVVESYGATQNVGHVYTSGGALNSNQSWLIFDAFAPFKLVSVVCTTATAGNRLIEVKDAAGTTLTSVTVNIPTGVNRINLNLDINPGTDLRLVAPANCGLIRLNAGLTFPYSITNLVSIKNSSAGTGYYYYFFDWEVQPLEECISSRTPVTATIETATTADITISASQNNICSGTSVTFTSTQTNGGTTPAYQWQVNGSNVGTNSSTFTSTTLNNNDAVTCIMTSSSACVTVNPVTSNSITMNVTPTLNPQVSIASSTPMPVCDGSSITFTATATDGGATPSYQWYVNGSAAGTNSATYTSALTDGDIVTCELTVSETCTQNQSVTSNTVTVSTTVMTPPVTTGASRCGAGTVTLSASGTGTLEWFDVATGGTALNTGTTYTTPSLSATTTYYVQASGGGSTQTVGNTQSTTNGAGSTVAGYLIFTAYQNLTILSVEVNNTGAAGNKTISLQNSSGTTLDSRTINVPSGVSRIELNFNVPAGTNYRLYAPANTNFWRNNTGFAFPYTSAGLISITGSSTAGRYFYFYSWYVVEQSSCVSTRTPVTATIETPGEASIAISASQTDICSGESVTFTSTSVNEGTAPVYQWQVNGVNAGTNSPSFTTTTLNNDDEVTCILTSNNTCITINPVTSNTIAVGVTPTINPQISVTASAMPVCAGSNITFTASVSDEGADPAYQWYVNGVPAGNDSPTFSSSTLANGDEVYCELSVIETCTQNASVNSAVVTTQVTAAVNPTVTIQTATPSVCIGDMITFTSSITNGGTSPVYQWQINGSNAGTGGSSFTTSALSDGDEVTCILTSNAACASPASVTSNGIMVTVASNLVMTADVSGPAIVCTGETATFTVTTTNAGATPVYQWQVNGVNSGTNAPSFSYNGFNDNDAVTCIVYSSLGCVGTNPVTSTPVHITVNSQLILNASIAGDNFLCTSESTTFTAIITEGGTNPSYDWQINGGSQGNNATTFTVSSLNDGDVISFILTSSGACIANSPAVYTVTAHVDNPPVADFTYTANELEISFTSSDQGNNHLWDFGDGNTSTDVNPVYTYAQDGMYIVNHYVANYCDTVSVLQSVNAIGVGMVNAQAITFNVYPIPSNGTLYIETNRSFAGNAEITDISGRVVFTQNMSYEIRHSLDISNLESGVYFLNLTDVNGVPAAGSIRIINQ